MELIMWAKLGINTFLILPFGYPQHNAVIYVEMPNRSEQIADSDESEMSMR